jgi:hypothetical protein
MKTLALSMMVMLAIAACARAPQKDYEVESAAEAAARAEEATAAAERGTAPAESPSDGADGARAAPPPSDRSDDVFYSQRANPVAAAPSIIPDEPAAAAPPAAEPSASSAATPPLAEAPDGTKRTPGQIYWNTWIEPPCGLTKFVPFKPCPVGSARRAAENRLVLSVSMDDLASRISILADSIAVPASGDLPRLIEELGGAPFRLAVIPVLTDGSVELVEGRDRVEYFRVEPEKLVPPEANEDVVVDTDLIKLAKRARAASAGMLELPLFFTEQAPPCTHVTLAIWDGQLRRPIDSLTVAVSVGPEPGDHCEEGATDSRVRSGVSSFVSFADVAIGAPPATSLSVHSFEFDLTGSPRRGFVVVAGHENGKPYIYGWEAQRPISELLSRTGALPARIKAARVVLADPNRELEDRKRAYGEVGKYLRDALFTARKDREPGKAAAKDALATFKRIASRGTQGLTVHAQFTTPGLNGHDLFYAPLRLLAAAGADGVTGDLRIIQPLAKRHGAPETCVDRWTIIAAPGLITADQDPNAKQALDAMLEKQPVWVAEMIRDSKRLSSFFAGEAPPPAAALAGAEPATDRAEGVLLLAHHSDDAGFYFEEGHGVMIERAERMFRPGSVAVLAACATASAGSADGFLKWLNASRVDSVFASPFLVDASYATLMSHEIFKELDRAYTTGATPTLGEILQSAVAQTGMPGGSNAAENLLQLQGMEYVVAGNPNVRLCRLQALAPGQQTATAHSDE